MFICAKKLFFLHYFKITSCLAFPNPLASGLPILKSSLKFWGIAGEALLACCCCWLLFLAVRGLGEAFWTAKFEFQLTKPPGRRHSDEDESAVTIDFLSMGCYYLLQRRNKRTKNRWGMVGRNGINLNLRF